MPRRTSDEWAALMWQVLVATAAERRTITYGGLQRAVGLPGVTGHVMGAPLARIREWCDGAGKPDLTVLVVGAGTGRPGGGYHGGADAERERVYARNWWAVTPPSPA